VSSLSSRYLMGFMSIGVLAGISNGISKVALPLFAAHLHASSFQIGLVGGLQFAGTLLLSLPIGALIDQYGSRSLYRFGGLGGAVLYLVLFPYFSMPWQLVFGVICFGLVNPFRMVTTQTEFLCLLPQLGLSKAGWQRGAHTLGMFFIGPLLGAFLIDRFGFADTFRLVSVGLLVTVLIGNRVMSSISAPGSGAECLPFLRRLLEQYRIVAARPDVRQSMLIEFFGQLGVSYFNVFIVLIAIRHFDMPTQMAAGLISLQGALFVLTLFMGGGLLARFRDPVRYVFAFSLVLAGELVLSSPPAALWLWVGAALLGLGVGTQHLTSLGRFAALAHEHGRGRVGGLFSFAGPAGGLIGAVAGGLLNQYFSPFAGFQVMALLYVFQLAWQVHTTITGIGKNPSGLAAEEI
jgi:MFS family permease